MIGLDKNDLRNMNSSQILQQEFLRCDSNKNVSEKQNIIQKAFLKASIGANEPTYVNQPIEKSADSKSVGANEPIYETIKEVVHVQALYSEPVDNKEFSEPIYATIDETIHAQKSGIIDPQQKIESVISKKSLLTIEGSFKKRDAKNIQRIKDTTQILNMYNPGQVNFDVQFNIILNVFKNLKSSSSKLAAFLYVLDSTKDKEDSKIQINNKKIYKELPRKYKKIIKKSNPKFSIDMRSAESLKTIGSIRTHLDKRSIFIKEESLPLKNRI